MLERSFDGAPMLANRTVADPPAETSQREGTQPRGGGTFLGSLNVQQREAVGHGIDAADTRGGPLLIIAGAGSGKTNTLAHRVAHLVAAGADPHRVLLLTFSRRAAAEMERRASSILRRVLGAKERQLPQLSWAGTFHGIGARLLRHYSERIGLSPSFTIHDRTDSEDLLALIRHDLGLSQTRERFPMQSTCMAIYSRLINAGSTLGDVLKVDYPWCTQWQSELHRLFEAYVWAKQQQNVLDYDDLLLYWSHMLADAALAREIGARFDHVLVDEYQDTNALQASILLALKPDGRGVTVVGDDAQSIYSFRAATVRNILEFPASFSPPARVVTLERNYRSTQPILDACNAVIALSDERYGKNLWSERVSQERPRLVALADEASQARYVADCVLAEREQGSALKEQAVLFRSGSHSAQLELELGRRAIPYVKYGGLKFLESAHIKDVLSVLRWAENPKGRMAGFRATRLVAGIGPATAARLLDSIATADDALLALASFQAPATATEWGSFVATIRALRQAPQWPSDIDLVRRWYEPQLERLYEDAGARLADVIQLGHIAATYPSRERFLTEMTLDPPAASSDEAGVPSRDDDYLILSTIHSAKGQEWKAVYVLNVVDGCIPSDMSTGRPEDVEEERRLLYVAMTRAKDRLQLIVPQRFYVHGQNVYGDRHVYATRSRFLPESLLPLFDSQAWPEPCAAEHTSHTVREPPPPTVDIAARVRARWR
jgi:DNA helicase-2/ATP-dependent DNA helicase PcrA